MSVTEENFVVLQVDLTMDLMTLSRGRFFLASAVFP